MEKKPRKKRSSVRAHKGFRLKEEREEKTRIKAYELYAQRGYISGNEVADWIAAEQLIAEEQKRR